MKAQDCPRDWALYVLLEVEEQGAYANLALGALLDQKRAVKLDRAFTTELVYGTLRTLNTLDWVLHQFSKRAIADLRPVVRNILRLGTYQVLYMDRVPDSAAVNESAHLARRHSHAGIVKYVNGVLRNLVRGKKDISYPDPKEDPVPGIALLHSHPQWLVRYWLEMLGYDQTLALCRSNNQPAPNTVRVNTLKTDAAQLQKMLLAQGLKVRQGQYAADCMQIDGFVSPGSLPAFQAGLLQIQGESSILVGQALKPRPGSRVIDAAGAPGGKATHLAQLMQNQGEILTLDVHAHKIKLIEANCRRLDVRIVRPQLQDARSITAETVGLADYLLVDAPCSGLGVLRGRPDSRWRKDEGQIQLLAQLQKDILDAAASVLKPGGVLVYSTCTITREENSLQLEKFLHNHREFRLESLVGRLPSELDHEDTLRRGYVQIRPDVHNLDGFFIARLRKG